MSREAKEVVRRWIEVLNDKDLERLDEVLAPDFINHTASGVAPDRDGYRERFTMWARVAPDYRFTVDDCIAEGERVAVRWSLTGTQEGELMGIAPTGERTEITGAFFVRVEGGQIVEHWDEADILSLLVQLGLDPIPGASG